MDTAQLFVVLVIIVPLVLAMTNVIRLDVAGALIALVLALGQYLGLGVLGKPASPAEASNALAGLAAPVTVTLFSLFVVTRCLEKTGVARWAATRILEYGGQSEACLIGLLSAVSAFFSLFMNNLAAGALVLPSAMEVSRRTAIRPSKLLIPVAYGSCLGGAATYFTTSNIIASDMLRSAHPPQLPLHILDFTPVGGLIAITGILFLTFFGSRFLPDHEPSPEQLVVRRTGSEMETRYGLEGRLWEVGVPASSFYAAKMLEATGIGKRFGLTVVAVVRKGGVVFGPAPNEVINPDDRLLVIGRQERVEKLCAAGAAFHVPSGESKLSPRGATFVEVVLIPGAKAEGQTLRQLRFRTAYGLTVVAIRRSGRSYRTDIADMPLKQGDSLLAVGDVEKFRALEKSSDFLMIESDPGDQPVDWKRAAIVIGVTLAAVIASIAGVPVYLGMTAAALFLILLGVTSMRDVYRTMEWQALVLVAGMYPVSLAVVESGLASELGAKLISVAGPFGPLGFVAGGYLLTALLSQVIAGQVTTLITAPILIDAATSFGTNPRAVAVASAIACSTSFLTPFSHPVNSLVLGPGNYRFGDFFRAGWLLSLISFVMMLIGMWLFWEL